MLTNLRQRQLHDGGLTSFRELDPQVEILTKHQQFIEAAHRLKQPALDHSRGRRNGSPAVDHVLEDPATLRRPTAVTDGAKGLSLLVHEHSPGVAPATFWVRR